VKGKPKKDVCRVRNCASLVANATKHFALATRISQLVASGRLTISCHDNYTNNNLHDFQPNRLKGKGKLYLARVAHKIKFKAARQSVTSFLPFRCF